ncbi:MAG TPA: hypothetical protein ENN84_09335 [Candidatus Marinimicrobia bacterium]|nr:hypothetical protein [Candidatus Neomarinimicrobiota bacterium]
MSCSLYLKKIALTITALLVPLLALEEYPEWFLYQGRFPGITVGYAYGGSPDIRDAEIRYAIYKACQAEGTQYRFQDYDEKHSAYSYDCGAKALKKIKGELYPIDRFLSVAIKKQFIGAFSTDPDFRLPKNFIKVKDLPRPDWLNGKEFFKDKKYYYGVGMYPLGGNENDAWMTAEDRAIFNILTTIEIQFHAVTILEKNESGDQMETVKATKIDFGLKNIEVMERFADKKGVYVLIRIAQRDVVSPSLRKKRFF